MRRSYLYVAHTNAPVGITPAGGGAITVYQYGASGSAAPVRTISGGSSGITTPIKPLVDNSGTLYVLDNNLPLSPGVFSPTIRVFGQGANSSSAPIRQITNIGGVSGNKPCSDMTFDPTGNFLFVFCGIDFFVFPVTANTIATSAVTASFEDDSTSNGDGLAFDQAGNLYVADHVMNQIRIYNAPVPTSGGFHLIAASGSIDGPSGGTAWPATILPFFLAIDNSGALFAPIWYQNATGGAPDSSAELAIFRGGNVCNNCTPSATLINGPFPTHAVDGVAIDPVGNVYVDNMFTNTVSVFSPSTIAGAGLGTTPVVLRTLTNNSPAIPGSSGMAIGP